MQVLSGGNLGALGNLKGLDTPFNIRTYTSSLILNQQSRTLGEVLLNDPAVRTTYGFANYSETFVIRGFETKSGDVALDGLYGVAPDQIVSPQLYEKVQVLNGPSAFLFGAAPGGSAQGGNINLEFKRAKNKPITRITADYTGSSMGGGAIDIGRRFGRDKAFGLRVNVAGRRGTTSVDRERRHSLVAGAAFDWHDPSKHTRVAIDLDYENEGVNAGRLGVFFPYRSNSSNPIAVPRPPSPSTNYAQPWSYTDLKYIFGKLKAEHDFGDHLTVYVNFGALGGDEKGNYGNTTIINTQTGDAYNGGTNGPDQVTNESVQSGVRSNFETDPIKHEVNVGGSALWNRDATGYASTTDDTRQYTNIYDPILSPLPPPETDISGNFGKSNLANRKRLWSLFFSDTVKMFDDRFSLTAGFRFQNIGINTYDYQRDDGQSINRYSKGKISPIIGFVFHPTRHSALYFNRIGSLAPGLTARGNVVNKGQIFPPYATIQYEAGVKYDTGHFTTTIDVFQLNQPNGVNIPIGDSGKQLFVLNGTQRNRGAELNINGRILKGLRFNGGTSIIEATQLNTFDAPTEGKRAVGVPGYYINGNLEYDLPFVEGATVTGRVVQTGHQWVDQANTLRIPNWTRFDLGARWSFVVDHKALTARFGVDNIANARFWQSSFNGYLIPNLPRTFKLSVTADL